MARTPEEIIAGWPKARQARVRARAAEMLAEIDSLKAVRKLAKLSQVQMAEQLRVKQSALHRMEKPADFYVSTLERFVAAAGGTVDIVVSLPGHAPLKLKRFGDIEDAAEA